MHFAARQSCSYQHASVLIDYGENAVDYGEKAVDCGENFHNEIHHCACLRSTNRGNRKCFDDVSIPPLICYAARKCMTLLNREELSLHAKHFVRTFFVYMCVFVLVYRCLFADMRACGCWCAYILVCV